MISPKRKAGTSMRYNLGGTMCALIYLFQSLFFVTITQKFKVANSTKTDIQLQLIGFLSRSFFHQ